MQRHLISRGPAGAILTVLVATVAIAIWFELSCAGAVSASTTGARLTAGAGCSAGARTLGTRGDVMFPSLGNGGYTSLHTDTDTVYDAARNLFLPGNHVDLTDRATQCLTSLSLDFESDVPAHLSGSPDLQVQSVSIDGVPASFRFAQPTYPGDPNGPDDPDPRAHEASQHDPVGGPDRNPLPPACSPELPGPDSPVDSRDGSQCPANKLAITPLTPIADGQRFTITVDFTGTPGVHHDATGFSEGWERTADGDEMASEPVGSEDWMPLNDYPSAKPTYDFSITTERGKTAIANGQRVSVHDNPPDVNFPRGSTTTVWRATMPIASYLPLTVVGDYTTQIRTVDGRRFYAFQDRLISAEQRARNARVIAKQPEITRFEAGLSGRFPFTSDGIVVGPPHPFPFETEETASMILFSTGEIDTDGLYHENFHQWWGDNVTGANFDMAFYKEGLARLAELLYIARLAEHKAGGAGTVAGTTAFEKSLVDQFDATYASPARFWTFAPSKVAADNYANPLAIYARPAAAYIALRQILTPRGFDAVLHSIQRRYAGSSITEPQLEAAFAAGLPDPSAACRTQMSRFFAQWFDTAYHGGRPQITGPALPGHSFYADGCTALRRP